MTGYGRRLSPLRFPFRLSSAALRKTAAALASACLLTPLATGCGALPGVGDADGAVTVMTWAPADTSATNMPGMPAMAQAYARWVNSRGGLGGRELRVLTCNEGNDPARAADCARRAVDEGAVAVVGSYSRNSRAALPPLEAAGIPYIGGYGVTDDEFSSPVSYPVNGGQSALLAGNGIQLAGVCERVSLVRPDSVSDSVLSALLNSGLAEGDRRTAADIPAAVDAGEYTEAALASRSRAGDSGGCVTAALGERTAHFFDSFRRLPPDGRQVRVASVLGSVDQPLIDRTGGARGPFEGAYVTGWYPEAGDPRWGGMRDVIRAHAFDDDRIDPADTGVQTTWIAYTVLSQAVASLGEDAPVTSEALLAAFTRGVRVDTGGLTPELRWRYQDMLGEPDFPRMVNHQVTFQVVRGGRLVAQRKGFVDVARTMRKASL
ncbi:ABC transporter substrate-binding protein [Streptomyces sp. NPDC047097]|uniref:ABC transporter substrate-binding protein n=1 Tax=Streptomyces sp. NPDC047097 TaxID=3155260 RepID=UPI00340EA635